MKRKLTLEYWQEEGWYVGRLKGIPGVFSQGQTLQALEDNIREAYQLMMEEEPSLDRSDVQSGAVLPLEQAPACDNSDSLFTCSLPSWFVIPDPI